MLNYSILKSKVAVGPSNPGLRGSVKWFIHPASANSIWIWNGEDELRWIQVSEKGDSKFISSKVVADLTNRAPAVVRRMEAN